VINDVSDYINLLVRIAHIICNHCFDDCVSMHSFFVSLLSMRIMAVKTSLSLSWEANSHSSSREFPRLLWNQFHYLVLQGSPLLPIQSHINPISNISSYFSKINSNIFFHLRLVLPVFLPQYFMQYSCRPCMLYATHTSSSFIWSPE
jgi:hypothetical protein